MATFIGALLLLAAAYQIYRAAFLEHRRPDPSPTRSGDDRPDRAPAATPTGAETAEEARERVLSRQLVAGHLDPDDYQRLMSQLAHTTGRHGDPR